MTTNINNSNELVNELLLRAYLQHARVAVVGDEMDGTQVYVVLPPDARELGIQVDPMLFDERLQPLQVVVEDAVVELDSPALTRHDFYLSVARSAPFTGRLARSPPDSGIVIVAEFADDESG